MTALFDRITKKIIGDIPQGASVLRRLLLENAAQYKFRYLAAFACMSVVAGTTGASAWIMRDIINRIFIDKDEMMMWVIAGAVMVIYSLKGIFSYLQQVILVRTGSHIIANLQRRVFDKLLAQSLHFYQNSRLGDLTVRMSYNAQAAREAIDLIITSIGRDLLSLVSLSAVMIFMDPMMSLVMLVIFPAAVAGVTMLVRRVKGIMKQELRTIAQIVTNIQETSMGIRIVKAFNLEDQMREEMGTSINGLRKLSNRVAQLNAMTSPLMETLGGFAVSLVIMYGGWNVIFRDTDPGAFFAFITALLMAYEPAKRLARLNVQLQTSLVMTTSLYELLDQPITVEETPDAVKLSVTDGDVLLKNVSFAYERIPALDGLTLRAKPKSVTALVGPSGAGKTTIFGLIERFYDPQVGAVLIDGQNIHDVTFESLRSNIALVTQDTFLFDGTVGQNIAYGKPGASEEEIIEAAKNANAHDFILELPNGYDTPVGSGGTRLSGGQRQRIAIARAMLRDARILLLDEPTSALDAQSEHKVQEALNRLMKNRTTIVIAHRLSTIRSADCIYVMDKGKVVQSGTHEELITEGGLYANLHALQFREPGNARTVA